MFSHHFVPIVRHSIQLVCKAFSPPGGWFTPYIQMIEMIVVFLGVVIGDLVFLGIVQAKSFEKIKLVFVRL